MVEKRIVFCAVLVGAFLVAAVKVDQCEPDCSSTDSFGKVPDPMNCSNFYYCLADHTPSDQPVPCPPGTSFPTDGTGTDCTGIQPCESICGGAGTGVACHLTCNGTGDYISDPFDCSVYYECDAAGPLPGRTCPSDRPHFDGESCVNNADVCCVSGCSPVCEAPATQIPDPVNCDKYYICDASGEPDDNLHFDCPAGTHFDIPTGHCTGDAQCQILCQGTTTAGGGSGGVTTPSSGGSSPGGSTSGSGGSTPGPGGSTPGPGGSTGGSGFTTTLEVTTGECLGSLICEAAGFFAKCITCQPQYFFCESVGQPGIEQECEGGLVFNPVPEYPYCILPSNCPFTP